MKHVMLIILLSFSLLSGCTDEVDLSPNVLLTSFQIPNLNESDHGIFDPSVTVDPISGRIWMSYSAVQTSSLWASQNDHAVTTRLAYSDNQGQTWTDEIEINPYQDVTLPLPAPNNAGTWHNEVSSLIYDPGAPASERWKLIWHHYLLINGSRQFEHGWIALKMASSPQGLATAQEIKLFGANGYDSGNDTEGGGSRSPLGGAPKIDLHTAYATELNNCRAFTEPGFYATADALYLELMCANLVSNKVFLLKCESPCDVESPSSWIFLGVQLDNDDALNNGYLQFSAPDLFSANGKVYLMATPTSNEPFNDSYNGCLIFEFEDIDTGTLVKIDDQPVIQNSVFGSEGSFNGACTFNELLTGSGVLYSQAYPDESEVFRIFASAIFP